MSAVYLLVLVVAWWIAAGLYGRRQSISRNLGEQPSLGSALLQGPFCVQKMLIWSTITPAPEDQKGTPSEDRARQAVPQSAPILNPLAAAQQGQIGLGSTPQAAPQAAPQPTPQAAPQAAPLAAPQVAPQPTPQAAPQPAPPAAPPAIELPQEQMPIDKPKRIPGKPVFGTVKCLCPTCREKTKYGKDAICQSCGNANPWLVAKWKLDEVEEGTDTAPQPTPQTTPQVAPQVAPQPAPQAAPQAAPKATPQVAPQVAPQPAPQAVTSPETQIEEARELPPSEATPPRRIPSKPMFGTVKCLCPWCQEKTKYGKDAICEQCGRQNPWLTEKWGLAASHATPMPTTGPSLEALQAVRKTEQQDVLLVELDPDQEIEAFDELPDRPRVGKVQTVCPHCHTRTKHNREGVCQECGQPNDWLRKRWGLIEMGAAVEVAPAGPAPVAPEVAPISDPSLCSSCGRARAADLEGNCIFCGSTLGGGS